MAVTKQKTEALTEGRLLPKIILFTLPLMASGVLQMLFNAADTVVVGRWGGATPDECENALAAVGSCGSLITLIVNFFMGLSVGAGVCAAHAIGARQSDEVQRVVHTSTLTALICGGVITVIGMVFARPLLEMMGTDPAVIDQAVQYMRAYFLGAPASMLYNYCAAVLRSNGDTKNPLVFLTVAGVANVALNLVTVLVFRMGAVGVGIATAASHWISCILVILHMIRLDDDCRLNFRQLRIHRRTLIKMIGIGLPAGIQSTVFSFSNVLIQSAINSFGKVVVASHTAAVNICNFIYVAQNSLYHTTITFVGQSVGAKEYRRIKPTLLICIACVIALGGTFGSLATVFFKTLLGIYLPANSAGLEFGVLYAYCVALPYFILGMQEIGAGLLRGLGLSTASMAISLVGICALRVLWVYAVFGNFAPLLPEREALFLLYLSYPVTWVVTGIATYTVGLLYLKKKLRENTEEQEKTLS